MKSMTKFESYLYLVPIIGTELVAVWRVSKYTFRLIVEHYRQ